jgi:hypothetical protein
MGFFRWRKAATTSSESRGFEAVVAELTAQGVLIITRDNGGYTVYWARDQPLKRSVEGRGATALDAILDVKAQSQKHVEADAMGRVPGNAKTPDKPAAR